MGWSVCFLIVMSIGFPSAYLQDAKDVTDVYKNKVADGIPLTSLDSLSITVSLDSGEEVTFTPDALPNPRSFLKSMSMRTIESDSCFTYEVNAVFSLLFVDACCSPSDYPYCSATIKPFVYFATFEDVGKSGTPTFSSATIEMKDSIDVRTSISLNDNLASKVDFVQLEVADQMVNEVTVDGPPGVLLKAIEDALNDSILDALF